MVLYVIMILLQALQARLDRIIEKYKLWHFICGNNILHLLYIL